MKQAICSCGRIAEVRHRKNGQKLAYLHCVNCGGPLLSAVKAAELESRASEDIGVKGEFPNGSSAGGKGDWKPAPDEMPEKLEPEDENSKGEGEEKPARAGNGFKVVIGIAVAVFLGGGAYAVSKAKG